MHYIPESACEFLRQSDAAEEAAQENFHYQSIPVYLLTLIVGGLLLADFLLGLINNPAWLQWRTVGGMRLALLAAVLGGARILYQSLDNLLERRIGADLALSIATVAAILLGDYPTAALVVFIALCGESLEGYTVDRARRMIRSTFDLCPPTAHLLQNGTEQEVPLSEIQPGQQLVVRPGERVPVDGLVIEGNSTVDESALTGESRAVEKTAGAKVSAGTLNQFGALTISVQRVGQETTLAQVVQLVSEAASKKANLERTADRLAKYFLPVVLLAAGITLLAWRWSSGTWSVGFHPALGVLVVACPCPLVLATPTAIMAAMAWLARNGIVVKRTAALEELAGLTTVAFDKTGTLTEGRLQLAKIWTVGELPEAELLRTAAIAERRSEHPLARFLVKQAEGQGSVLPPVQEFTNLPGAGVKVRVRAGILGPWAEAMTSAETSTLHVGKTSLLESVGVNFPEEFAAMMADSQTDAQSMIAVALDDQLLGVLFLEDSPRAGLGESVTELQQAGITEFAMLTGDRQTVAEALQQQLPARFEIHAEQSPAEKAAWIQTQLSAGKQVAMVGDGINDAPALATATVGLAVGKTGTDLAADAGDFVLMGDPLRPLPALLRLSRALVQNIRQSILLFAFGINLLGMLLCAVGILSPVAGAVFHEFSSLAVMLNALRLLWFERTTEQDSETESPSKSNTLANSVDWITTTLSPSRLAFGIVDQRATLLRLTVAGLLFYWLCGNLVLIRPDESALVTRFGKFHAELSPGVSWRWPSPLERVYRERTDELKTIELGFEQEEVTTTAPGEHPAPIEWSTSHTESLARKEALILTGEEVPLELTAELHYRIADFQQYQFGVAEPAALLKAIAESVVRETAAGTSMTAFLTEHRQQLEQHCLKVIRQRANEYGLGIAVQQFHLLDVHPPTEVVAAYRDVADALEQQQQFINEGQGYATRKLLEVGGEEALTMLSAETRPGERNADDWELSDEFWSRLLMPRGEQPYTVSGEVAAGLLTAEQNAYARLQQSQSRAARFQTLYKQYQTHPRLTLTHLYWKSLEATLQNRPLLVIDPKAARNRHLMLGSRAASPIFPQVPLQFSTTPETDTEEQNQPVP